MHRINHCWQPYHQAVQQMIDEAYNRFALCCISVAIQCLVSRESTVRVNPVLNVQLKVNRTLYMDETTLVLHCGFFRLQDDLRLILKNQNVLCRILLVPNTV